MRREEEKTIQNKRSNCRWRGMRVLEERENPPLLCFFFLPVKLLKREKRKNSTSLRERDEINGGKGSRWTDQLLPRLIFIDVRSVIKLINYLRICDILTWISNCKLSFNSHCIIVCNELLRISVVQCLVGKTLSSK